MDASGKPVKICRGIEVGHIFQLGDKYTRALETTVLDKNGKSAYPLMGCYGIGVSRIVGAAIEQSHDEKGIVWPKSMSPFDVHFIAITKSDEYLQKAEEIYLALKESGIDVLFDDRKVGPGFKFKDADLLGVPTQLVLGERDFKNTQELSIIDRKSGTKTSVKVDDLVIRLKEQLKEI